MKLVMGHLEQALIARVQLARRVLSDCHGFLLILAN
jgi:hypothetical protein